MKRRTGYIANMVNVPPLIFKFQFNPELLSEKKSFGYRETQNFGKWEFDRTKAESGFGNVFGVMDDLKEFGSLLVGTKALEADAGTCRTSRKARPVCPSRATTGSATASSPAWPCCARS